MFDNIYKRVFVQDKDGKYIYDSDGNRIAMTVERTPEEIRDLPDDEYHDLNLIHKKWGGGRFLSMRLSSFVSGKDGNRVTKVLMEFGITDENDKLQECNKIYMDIPKFAYLCEMLRSGKLRERIDASCDSVLSDARKAYKRAVKDAKERGLEKPDFRKYIPTQKDYSKPVFDDYGGNETTCRVLKIYTGWDFKKNERNDKICFEAGSGPGKVVSKGGMRAKGGIMPDGWTKENSTKVMVGFTDNELGEAGMAGLRAIQIMDQWSARGCLETNLDLINVKRVKDDAQSRTQARPQQKQRNDYAGNRRYSGNGRSGDSYYRNGYATGSGW